VSLNLEPYREEIIALCPVYSEEGNATRIILRSGEKLVPQGIKSVHRALLRSYGIDIKSQREFLKRRLPRSGNLPFYLGPGRVFAPVKMRRTRADNDAVHGHVDISCWQDTESIDEGSCMLSLKDGRSLGVFSPADTAQRAYYLGHKVAGLIEAKLPVDPATQLVMQAASQWFSTIIGIANALETIQEKMMKEEPELKPQHNRLIESSSEIEDLNE
jgi:hypothetical protein